MMESTDKECTRGKLIIIGGNEDKGIETKERDQLEFVESSILARILKESGGNDAKIVLIPTASSIPQQVIENYLVAFGRLGYTKLQILDIRKREQTDREENLQMIREANCVLISGGNQSEISDKIGGTEMHRILLKRHSTEEDFVIAGTSAGAMCMSEEMITGGSGKEFFRKGTVDLGTGLGFIPKLIIDSHFIRRGRFARLAEAVTHFSAFLGVGLAEDTALVVSNCSSFEVIGSGMVVIFDPSKLTYNNEPIVEENQEITIANLRVHILAKGTHFCLKKREIKVIVD